jgi:hypothetical protein
MEGGLGGGAKMTNKERLRFCFDTMSLNEHLMQWYRAVLVAFDAGVIISMLSALRQADLKEPTLYPFIMSLLWVWLTTQRERIVNRQRDIINELTGKIDDEDLSHCFKIYGTDLGCGRYLAPLIFNFFLPLIVGFLLIAFAWLFKDSCWIWWTVVAVLFVGLSILAKWKLSRCGVPKDDQKPSATSNR